MQPDILTPGQDLNPQYRVKKSRAVGWSMPVLASAVGGVIPALVSVSEKASRFGISTAHQQWADWYFNPPERLHPVDLFVTIKIPAGHLFVFDDKEFTLAHDVAVRAKREQHLENRDQPRVYVDENGYQYTGKFEWAYH